MTTDARATIHRHRLMFGRSRSRSTSPLTPNATARERDSRPSPRTLDVDSLASRAAELLADASAPATGGLEEDGERFARINEARRLIESIRAKGRNESDASRRERAAAAVGMLEELANDAAERAASGRFAWTRRRNRVRIQWIGFIQWIDARGRADGDADGVGVGVGARTDGVAYVAERIVRARRRRVDADAG